MNVGKSVFDTNTTSRDGKYLTLSVCVCVCVCACACVWGVLFAGVCVCAVVELGVLTLISNIKYLKFLLWVSRPNQF